MAIIKREYLIFYVLGRQERRLPKIDLDPVALAKAVLEASADASYERQSPLRHTIFDAYQKAMASAVTRRRRRVWATENAELIAKSGGDEEAAYRAWIAGMVDELAFANEEDLLAEIALLAGGEPAGGDEGEEDEEDDDEEDEEEEEDDDDDDEIEAAPRRSPDRRR